MALPVFSLVAWLLRQTDLRIGCRAGPRGVTRSLIVRTLMHAVGMIIKLITYSAMRIGTQ